MGGRAASYSRCRTKSQVKAAKLCDFGPFIFQLICEWTHAHCASTQVPRKGTDWTRQKDRKRGSGGREGGRGLLKCLNIILCFWASSQWPVALTLAQILFKLNRTSEISIDEPLMRFRSEYPPPLPSFTPPLVDYLLSQHGQLHLLLDFGTSAQKLYAD